MSIFYLGDTLNIEGSIN